MAKLLFDHFVVLMLENRSFDHLFGYLGKGEGIPAGGATNHLKPNDPTLNGVFGKEGRRLRLHRRRSVPQPEADQRTAVRQHKAERRRPGGDLLP